MTMMNCTRINLARLGVATALLAAYSPALAQQPSQPGLQPPPTTQPGLQPPGTQPGAPAQQPGFGLQPPPPPTTSAPNATEHQLERSEREDSGRGLQFVMLHTDVGFQWLSFNALSDSDLVDGSLVADDAMGLAVGAGLGFRLLYLTLGGRFRFGLLDNAKLWSAGLEANLRIPKGAFEPYVLLGAGFTQVASFEGEDAVFALGEKRDDLGANGFNVRLGGGFDYFITPVFSAGVRADADLLLLSRSAVVTVADTESIYEQDGSAIGLAVTGLASLGLHF